jgi:hypothetical protein
VSRIHIVTKLSSNLSEKAMTQFKIHLPQPARRLDLSEIQFINGFQDGDLTAAKYKDESVWIEYKPAAMINGRINPEVLKLTASLMRDNRHVLLHVPCCLGYIFDECGSRFGIVFKKPPTSRVTSLHSLIKTSNVANSPADTPSPTHRLKLMQQLAKTFETLHAIGWLHKGFRSSSVLFFKKVEKSKTFNFDEAYISGFDIQQPVTSHDETDRPNSAWADIYRHPMVQSTGNCKVDASRESYEMFFDWYSLGIVLLEIVHWRSIDKILSIDSKTACPEQTQAVKKRLLKEEPEHLSLVKHCLGETIEKVIRVCLAGPEASGDYDKKEELGAAASHNAFSKMVVDQLGSVKGSQD